MTVGMDLPGLVARLAKNPEIAHRGLQGVHAEIMRQLASEGSPIFVDYSEIREIWRE